MHACTATLTCLHAGRQAHIRTCCQGLTSKAVPCHAMLCCAGTCSDVQRFGRAPLYRGGGVMLHQHRVATAQAASAFCMD